MHIPRSGWFVAGPLGWLCALGFVALAVPPLAAEPLRLHPENPRYFLFRGRPTALITSGEHYGAVLNADFDYRKYLDTLAADGLNLTRTFTGAYVEPVGAFNIVRNTLAPAPGRFLCPWARSDTPGYALGGNKFDLQRWDEAYFARLRDFVAYAGQRGVVVELNLFCPFYEEAQWNLSPQNARNHVNGVGQVARTNVYTLDRHGGLLGVHEALVRKLVTELKDADNLYYEICNEPYFGGVTLAWQARIADLIVATEQALGVRHLISQNIANGSARVAHPHPAVSIFNFHYASPPEAVAANAHLKAVIGDNETGFRGTNDTPYRVEAWNFMLAGGGLFNHLDYSFAVGHEDGTFVYPASQPGGGNPAFRRQMKTLASFLAAFDFVRLRPDTNLVASPPPAGWTARALSEPGRAYALYFAREPRRPAKSSAGTPPAATAESDAPPAAPTFEVALDLPPGTYRAAWIDPLTGAVAKRQRVVAESGAVKLTSPEVAEDVALRLTRRPTN